LSPKYILFNVNACGNRFSGNFLIGNVSSPSGGNYATGYAEGGAFAPYIEASDRTGGTNVNHSHDYSGATGGGDVDHTHTVNGNTASNGASGTNANMPPYQVVYMWNRTA
jgi:hypothetical protein